MIITEFPDEILTMVIVSIGKDTQAVQRFRSTCNHVNKIMQSHVRDMYSALQSLKAPVSKTRRALRRELVDRLKTTNRRRLSALQNTCRDLEWRRLKSFTPAWRLVLPKNSHRGWIELRCPHCTETNDTNSHSFELGSRCCPHHPSQACPGYTIAAHPDPAVEAMRRRCLKWDEYRQECILILAKGGSQDAFPPRMNRPW